MKKSNKIFVDGILNRDNLKNMAHEASIQSAINEWNNMFTRRYGWFSICTVNATATRFRSRSFFSMEEKYLTTFHCVDWKDILPETRDTIAGIMISYIGEPRIGYNKTTKLFVDMNDIDASGDEIYTVYSIKGPQPTKNSFWQKLKELFK